MTSRTARQKIIKKIYEFNYVNKYNGVIICVGFATINLRKNKFLK